MSEAPLMLGVSGLRGIVGESLTPEVAVRYAAAFGAWLRGGNVMVARDGRAGGETIYEAVIQGLLQSGCDVYEADVQMTPTVGCVIQSGQFIEAGVIVTASHNPQEWNGIKLLVEGAAETGRRAFVVPTGRSSQAYGLHHASSYAYQAGAYHRRRWFTVRHHMSFHMAITPTDERASPFTLFDGVRPEDGALYDESVDTYAVGMLLWALATRRDPHACS